MLRNIIDNISFLEEQESSLTKMVRKYQVVITAKNATILEPGLDFSKKFADKPENVNRSFAGSKPGRSRSLNLTSSYDLRDFDMCVEYEDVMKQMYSSYAIFSQNAKPSEESGVNSLSTKLQDAMKQISKQLVKDPHSNDLHAKLELIRFEKLLIQILFESVDFNPNSLNKPVKPRKESFNGSQRASITSNSENSSWIPSNPLSPASESPEILKEFTKALSGMKSAMTVELRRRSQSTTNYQCLHNVLKFIYK